MAQFSTKLASISLLSFNYSQFPFVFRAFLACAAAARAAVPATPNISVILADDMGMKTTLKLITAACVLTFSGSALAFVTEQKPVLTCDIAVIGGGSAGFGAAWSAAHLGSAVILVEKQSMLGGTSTIGGVNNWEPGMRLNGATLVYRITPLAKNEPDRVEPLPEGVPEKCWWQGGFPVAFVGQYPGGDRFVNMLPTLRGEEVLELGPEKAYAECRRRVLAHWHGYQKNYDEFRRFQLKMIFPMMGLRETRRVRGEYVLTQHDLIATFANQKHDDIIAMAKADINDNPSIVGIRTALGNPFVQLDQDGSGQLRFIVRDASGNKTANALSAQVHTGTYGMYAGRLFKGADTVWTNRVYFSNSSSAEASAWANFGATADLTSGTQYIGGLASTHWDGDIAEIMIYARALSEADTRQVEEYLASRYKVDREAAAVEALEDVPGLKLWLRADACAYEDLFANDAAEHLDVARLWSDATTNSHDALAIETPTFITNMVNGLPALGFSMNAAAAGRHPDSGLLMAVCGCVSTWVRGCVGA